MQKHRFILMILLLTITVMPTFAQAESVTIMGGDEASISRLLEKMSANYSQTGSHIEIWIEQLPDDLPFDLEIPENMEIIGSIDRGEFGGIEVYAESTELPQDISATFAEIVMQLPEWTLMGADMRRPTGGFVDVPPSFINFCHESGEMGIMFTAQPSAEITNINFSIQRGDFVFSCEPELMASSRIQNDPFSLIPELRSPEGVHLDPSRTGGGGGGGFPGTRFASQSAILKTELSLSEFYSTYTEQLEALDWEFIGSDVDETFSWSNWKFIDSDEDEWAVTFTISLHPLADDTYFANILIQE